MTCLGAAQVRIAHAEVDDVGAAGARGGLQPVDLLEDVRRQALARGGSRSSWQCVLPVRSGVVGAAAAMRSAVGGSASEVPRRLLGPRLRGWLRPGGRVRRGGRRRSACRRPSRLPGLIDSMRPCAAASSAAGLDLELARRRVHPHREMSVSPGARDRLEPGPPASARVESTAKPGAATASSISCLLRHLAAEGQEGDPWSKPAPLRARGAADEDRTRCGPKHHAENPFVSRGRDHSP